MIAHVIAVRISEVSSIVGLLLPPMFSITSDIASPTKGINTAKLTHIKHRGPVLGSQSACNVLPELNRVQTRVNGPYGDSCSVICENLRHIPV